MSSYWHKWFGDPRVPVLEEEVRYLRGLLEDFRIREKQAVDALLAESGKQPMPLTDPTKIGAFVNEYVSLFKDQDGAPDPDRVIA